MSTATATGSSWGGEIGVASAVCEYETHPCLATSNRGVTAKTMARHFRRGQQLPDVSATDEAPELDPGPSDKQLVAEFRYAGSDTFAVLYRRHARAVYGYASSVLNLASDVEEVVQDVFVLAWRKLEVSRMVGESALPWLLATARYLSYNVNRTRSRLRSLVDENIEALSVDGADAAVDEHLAAARIGTALAKLGDVDRKIVELCLVRGLTYKEAAHRLGLTHGAIRNRLSRARELLRVELHVLKGDSP